MTHQRSQATGRNRAELTDETMNNGRRCMSHYFKYYWMINESVFGCRLIEKADAKLSSFSWKYAVANPAVTWSGTMILAIASRCSAPERADTAVDGTPLELNVVRSRCVKINFEMVKNCFCCSAC
jgi:hypothetical protein